jgi:hypothetical protein
MLFTLHEKVPKCAKIISSLMENAKINVHGEFAVSVLPSSHNTPIDITLGLSRHLQTTVPVLYSVHTRLKPIKCRS